MFSLEEKYNYEQNCRILRMVQPEFKYVHISCLLFTLLHNMWSKHVSILENSSHSNSPSLSPFLTCIWAVCIICYEVIIFNAHQTATILMMHFFWISSRQQLVSWAKMEQITCSSDQIENLDYKSTIFF